MGGGALAGKKPDLPISRRPITDIPTLGEASADKLAKAGIVNVAGLATATPTAIAAACGNEIATARRWCESARQLLEEDGFIRKSTMTGLELLRLEEAATRIPLGTPKLDAFLNGGLEGGAVYEIYGEAHNGKSQFCFQATVEALREPGGTVVYVETENAFKARRVKQIAEERGLDPEDVLSRVITIQPLTSSEQQIHIEALRGTVEDKGVRLIVCDSYTGLLRAEMAGRANYSDRSIWLSQNTGLLKSIARTYGIPVVLVNQVTTKMDGVMYGDDKIAWGGTGFAHAVTYCIKIYVPTNSRKHKFIMEDSPADPEREEILWIGPAGYLDTDPGKRREGTA